MTQDQRESLIRLRAHTDRVFEERERKLREDWIDAGLPLPGEDLSHNPYAKKESTR
jgi:hypothetical protein